MTDQIFTYVFFLVFAGYLALFIAITIYGTHLVKRINELEEEEKQRRYRNSRQSDCEHDHERPRHQGKGRHRKSQHNEQIPPLLGVVQPPKRHGRD